MRPSWGQISLAHTRPLAPSFDTVGWFARDAETLEKVGRALLMHDDDLNDDDDDDDDDDDLLLPPIAGTSPSDSPFLVSDGLGVGRDGGSGSVSKSKSKSKSKSTNPPPHLTRWLVSDDLWRLAEPDTAAVLRATLDKYAVEFVQALGDGPHSVQVDR